MLFYVILSLTYTKNDCDTFITKFLFFKFCSHDKVNITKGCSVYFCPESFLTLRGCFYVGVFMWVFLRGCFYVGDFICFYVAKKLVLS